MRCQGRTKNGYKCKRECKFVFCKQHSHFWFKVISFLCIIILPAIWTFIQIKNNYQGSNKINDKEPNSLTTQLFKPKDSLSFNILITRFEDFKSDVDTYCIGRSYEENLNVLKSNNPISFPIKVIYADTIPPPKNTIVAKNIQRKHNADLIIYGLANKVSNNCGEAEVCFRYKFDDNILPKEMSKFELKSFSHTGEYAKTTSSNIEKGIAQVDLLSMEKWIKSLVGIKSNRKETVLFDIAEIRNNIKNLSTREKAKNFNSLGEMYYDSKQYNTAKIAFEESIKLYPTAEFYRNLGKANRRKKNYKESLHNFKQGLKIDSKYDNSIGVTFLHMNKLDSALINYKKALILNPKNKFANNNIAKVYRINKNYPKAIEFYKKSLKLNPENKVSYFGLGIVFNNKKNYEKAIEYYTKSLKIDSSYAIVYSYRGYSFLMKGENEKAIKDLTKYISIVKDDYVDYSNRASAYNLIGEYDLAIKDCKKSISLNSNHKVPYSILGNIYYKQKKYSKALSIYDSIIEIDSLTPYYYKRRGRILYSLGEKIRAVNNFNKSILLDSTNAESHALRGGVFNDFKKHKEAIVSYNKSIELDSLYSAAIHNRGNIYFWRGDFNKAVEDMKKSVALEPNNIHYNFDLYHFMCWKYWYISLLIIITIVGFLFSLLKKKLSIFK